MRTLALIAAALLISGSALAQSATRHDTNPSPMAAPGPTGPAKENLSGITDPSKPGSGFKTPENQARQAPNAPKGAGVADPSKPGSGYGTGK